MDTRALTLELMSWPSVTGSEGERAFGPRLRDRLAGLPGVETWLEDAGKGRFTVCALARGRGRAGVVLAGHYDVVDDTGVPADPEALRALGEAAAADELATGDWLGGRGALDMKSGLAALIAVLARHAAAPDREGSVLLVACPDEEAHSAGARAAALAIRRLDLDWRLGINADVVTEAGDGAYGRAVFSGGVGKLLLCALLRGCPAHVGEPLAGLSAHWLAAEVVRDLEGQPWEGSATPPVLLGGGDTKAAYDVTMPRDVVLAFNLLTHEPAPAMLARFRDRVAGAVERAAASWPGAAGAVRIVEADVPAATADPIALAREALTAAAGDLAGPAAVVALGSVRYRAVPGADPALLDRLRPAAEAAGARIAGAYPHPSDISFLADGGAFPWVNAGPWGRDFHRPGERVYLPYACDVLPRLVADLAAAALVG